MSNTENLDILLRQLEAAADRLEHATSAAKRAVISSGSSRGVSADISSALTEATSVASAAIEAGTVEHADRDKWRKELQHVKSRCAHCAEPVTRAVKCVHGCEEIFCGKNCRKHASQLHQQSCHALKEKYVRKRLHIQGFTEDEELF